ncbi:uncharacterized protein LOC144903486 [Branchiostoma floridae x Branchiostoma belcheri]
MVGEISKATFLLLSILAVLSTVQAAPACTCEERASSTLNSAHNTEAVSEPFIYQREVQKGLRDRTAIICNSSPTDWQWQCQAIYICASIPNRPGAPPTMADCGSAMSYAWTCQPIC